MRSQDATVDDAAFQTVVEQTASDLLGMTGVVAAADTYYASGNPALVSADQHTTLIPVTLVGTLDDAEGHVGAYLDTVTAHRGNGFEVYSADSIIYPAPN